jgi:predicted protein tyrosine phosphatase
MRILVSPLSRVPGLLAAHAPERVVSLLDPDYEFPDLGPSYQGRHLRLRLHDVHERSAGQVAPTSEHVDQLLRFLAGWHRTSTLLIHCRAGIGRSTATAFIAACLHQPHLDERAIALELRRISPLARPNEVLVDLADAAMGRAGRMNAAIVETGRDLRWHHVGENVPFEMSVMA